MANHSHAIPAMTINELRKRWTPITEHLPELARKAKKPGTYWNSKGHGELAELLGCHVNTVRGWINGSHSPSDEALEVIERVAIRIGYEPSKTRKK